MDTILSMLAEWVLISIGASVAWYLMQERINQEEREREEDDHV